MFLFSVSEGLLALRHLVLPFSLAIGEVLGKWYLGFIDWELRDVSFHHIFNWNTVGKLELQISDSLIRIEPSESSFVLEDRSCVFWRQRAS